MYTLVRTTLAALWLTTTLVVAQPTTKARKAPTKAVASTRSPADLKRPIPFDPNVKVGKLPNGLTYYIRKNEEPKNRAELRLVVKAGSVLEENNQQGLAHFMEHMAFNGTKNFPKNELVSFLQSSGVRFGADLNAYTSFDETVYQLPVPTDNPELFERAFQILEDWAHNATLDPAEIDKERGVVLEEWRSGRGAAQRMREKYFPYILNNSRYADRLPIGKEEVLRTFKKEDLESFYQTWYRPDLMGVMAVGDFDIAKVESQIREKFGRIPKATNPKPRQTFTIPAHPDTKVVIVTDEEQPNTVVQLIYKRPEIKETTLNDLRESIKRSLFNIMLGNRIQELTQRADPPFLGGYSNYSSFIGNLDAFTSIAVAKGDNVERAIQSLLDETARVRKFGYTPTELERAKRDLVSGAEQAYNERNKTRSAAYVNQYVQHFLKNDPVTGVDFYYNFLKSTIDGVKLDEVNQLVNQFIAPENRAVVIMAPDKNKNKLPTVDQVLGWINNAGQNITAYVDQTLDSPLLRVQPTAKPIAGEKKIPEVGVTEWRLQNGVRVVLKPTTFKNDQILFTGTSFGGTSLYDQKDFESARFASTVTTLGGTGDYNQIQLGKYLSGKSLSVNPYIGELQEGISGSAAPKDLETALQLMYSYFTQPRKDAEVVQGFLSNQKSFLENQIATPTPAKVFQDTVQTVLGGGHPRRLPLRPEQLDRVNLDRSIDIYRERFADAGDFTFVFVGNFKELDIKPLIEKYLGGLPASNRQERYRDLGIRIPAGQISKTVYKGVDPKSTVRLVFSGDFNWTPETTTQIDALAEVLEIKLIEKLREEESSVYGVGVNGSYAKYPAERYTFQVAFGCAPENVEKLISKTLEEINNLKQRGADPKDIDKFKAETQRETEVQLKDNNFWLSYLSSQYYNGDDPKEILSEEERLKQVTVESTKAAANRYFGKNFIRLVLMPEKKE
ncbi:insulinase family protein [Nibrella saemangeumensis]|uniref:Insulinase family protein n=1 Tax=Nibrella saemangeumensis TaxID=1084526 RepID=A0ABP8MCU2_9BACT